MGAITDVAKGTSEKSVHVSGFYFRVGSGTRNEKLGTRTDGFLLAI
jgi:hypothetical protein